MVKVMTFNMRYDAPDDPYPWETRQLLAKQMISQYEPDILGLQEIRRTMLGDLRDLFGEKYDMSYAFRSDADDSEAMVILWQKDQFQLLGQDWLMLSETPDQFGSFGWDGACERIALYTAFQNQAGQKLYIVNTHFDHMGERARLESGHLLVELAKELTNGGEHPLLLMGDFNATYNDSELKPLFDYFQHAFAEDLSELEKTSYHDYQGVEAGAPIDYLFGNERCRVIQAKVIQESVNGQYPSDHYPVISEWEL